VSARQTRFPSPLSVLRTPIKGVDPVGHFIFFASSRPPYLWRWTAVWVKVECPPERLDIQIEDMMQPFQTQREPLTTIPGIGPFAAAAIMSEAGADIAETFPSADHFASWIGLCPGNRESAGKRYSGKPRKGNQHLQHVLVGCGWASSRTPGYLQSLYRWHVRKFGGARSPTAKNKAAVTVAHKLSVSTRHRQTPHRPRRRLSRTSSWPREREPEDSSPNFKPSDTP
jgi:hypothetical protein